MSKKVLFLAYNFPPHGGPGVQRSTKFVKYLRRYGWEPIIVTTGEDAAGVQDRSLLSDIPPETKIIRVDSLNLGKLIERAAELKIRKAAVALNVLLALPDGAIFWSRKIHSAIQQIIEEEKPDLVYTTSGPYSAHLAGKWVKQTYNLPWFADFRDPWSTNLLVPYPPGYRALNRRIERSVLREADRVSCVSRPWLNDLQQNLGEQAEKFFVLPNGYDAADITTSPLPTDEKFTITYMGSFYPNRKPQAFIQAIEKLIAQGDIPIEHLRCVFIGSNVQQYVPNEPPFETYGYMPHKELQSFRDNTHALLLILATSPENVGNHSGKIFEYVAANRPILGIVPPQGVAEDLITETGTGVSVSGDVDAIADGLHKLYKQWVQRFKDWNPVWSEIELYTRENLTKQLTQHFNEMVS